MEGKNRDTAHGILSLVSPPLSEEARRHFSFLEGPGLGLFYKNPTSKLTTVADVWGWERSVCLPAGHVGVPLSESLSLW